ncbi:TrkH family potassium uptake protein [Loigolactobacillus zhaoyuanensis]|uniref:TrkH family potassium uptake protein n=1 Tax=Loigolactobacillus zhaoyuanensis TaxID=2486017 RepID=UPI000F7464A5|nr:TrkH family potassium uptake protein [Loigolactobacillus zhaoyuanensis]
MQIPGTQRRMPLPKILTLGFLVLIVLGGLLLMLPLATRAHHTTPFIDAIFTATSAICITGLTTVNTAAHWSLFGQSIILLLIEIGGLGFMTFSVLPFVLLKRRVDLTTRLLIKESLNFEKLANVNSVMKYVIGLSLAIQSLGAALLFIDFYPRYGLGRGLFMSIFHSVSSFCNAGFDLFGNSLESQPNDVYLILVTSALIIAGGLGFLVCRDLLLFKRRKRLSLHTKLALNTSGILLLVGFVLFLLTENNLAVMAPHVNVVNRLVNTFFLTVTPRTAGITTIPYSELSIAGILLTIVLMFIGGTPGSTAGGIKTTTLGLLTLQSWAILRGNRDVEFGHRRFSDQNILRALMLVFISLVIIITAGLILTATETIPKHYGLEYVIFEVISAFSTAGMTMGLTPKLTTIGKFIIMLLMFLGRVGIYTVMFSVLNASHPQKGYRYPAENVMLG